jgi:hypothetical protein
MERKRLKRTARKNSLRSCRILALQEPRPGDHSIGAMQGLLHCRRPVDIGMKKASKPLPIPPLDRVEHIADRRYLLRHSVSPL